MKLRTCWWLILPCLLGLAWAGERAWTRQHQARLLTRQYEPPPHGMVLVPPGEFWMGSDDEAAEPDERPLRKVFVPAFYIDKFEVTNRRYKELIPDHRHPPGEEDLPVTRVLKREAEEFCRRAGRRLPTSAEWEKAARGTDGRAYPWGNEFSADRANLSRRGSGSASQTNLCLSAPAGSKGKLPGGSFPRGASPYGCEDMAGNVWEWVGDVWRDRSAFGIKRGGEPRGILRGGAYTYSPKQARASYQGFESLEATCHDVGFRCVMNAVPKSR